MPTVELSLRISSAPKRPYRSLILNYDHHGMPQEAAPDLNDLPSRPARSSRPPIVGVLEVRGDQGWLRSPKASYLARHQDPLVPTRLLRQWGLRTGDEIQATLSQQNDKPRIEEILSVNHETPQKAARRRPFEDLTPLFPRQTWHLERGDGSREDISGRIIDLMAPQGKGQRALVVSPPKAGKTMLLANIAQALEANHPEAIVFVLLIDERPEEVTEMRRLIRGEVLASTFDEPAGRHVQVAEMTIERGKRLVEQGKDVVILVDSITRLARAYNNTIKSSGKVLSGGVDANAMQGPKRIFGAARNTEEAGSLTIIATALLDTGSLMDQVIYEEFKGTGNSEVHLDRRISEKRLHPAVHVAKSGTRREEMLIEPDTLAKITILRRLLHGMDDVSATQFLLDKMKTTKSNDEFFKGMRG